MYTKILYFKCSVVEHCEELWQDRGWVRGCSSCPGPDDWACSAHQRNEAQARACGQSPGNPEHTWGVWGRGSHHPGGTCPRGQSSLHCVDVVLYNVCVLTMWCGGYLLILLWCVLILFCDVCVLLLFYCVCPHSVLWRVSTFCSVVCVWVSSFCSMVCRFILFCGMWVCLYFVLCECMLWIEGGIDKNVTDFIFNCLYRELSMFMGPRHPDRSSCLRKELWLQRRKKIPCLAAKFSSW